MAVTWRSLRCVITCGWNSIGEITPQWTYTYRDRILHATHRLVLDISSRDTSITLLGSLSFVTSCRHAPQDESTTHHYWYCHYHE